MQRFGSGNMDGFNMIGLLLPGVAVTYNGEEIGVNSGDVVNWQSSLSSSSSSSTSLLPGMTNTDVSWEDTVDPAGRNCGEDHFQDPGCSRWVQITLFSDGETWVNH